MEAVRGVKESASSSPACFLSSFFLCLLLEVNFILFYDILLLFFLRLSVGINLPFFCSLLHHSCVSLIDSGPLFVLLSHVLQVKLLKFFLLFTLDLFVSSLPVFLEGLVVEGLAGGCSGLVMFPC